MNPTTPEGSLLDWIAIRASLGSTILPPPPILTSLTVYASNSSGNPSPMARTWKLSSVVVCRGNRISEHVSDGFFVNRLPTHKASTLMNPTPNLPPYSTPLVCPQIMQQVIHVENILIMGSADLVKREIPTGWLQVLSPILLHLPVHCDHTHKVTSPLNSQSSHAHLIRWVRTLGNEKLEQDKHQRC